MSLTCIFIFSSTSVCCKLKLCSVCKLDMSMFRALKLPRTPRGWVCAKWLWEERIKGGFRIGIDWLIEWLLLLYSLEMCFCATVPVGAVGKVHSRSRGHSATGQWNSVYIDTLVAGRVVAAVTAALLAIRMGLCVIDRREYRNRLISDYFIISCRIRS